MRVGLTICALLLFTASYANGQSRPTNGFIVDATSTISRAERRKIDEVCRHVSDRTSGEILVCVVKTTRGRNPRQFATNLFNRWRIGSGFEDNGILVFVAMQDRKAEIVLGDGIDSAREQRESRTVMSDYMMPQFKRGNPSKGIRVAVEQCAKRFFRVDKQSTQPVKVTDLRQNEPAATPSSARAASRQPVLPTSVAAETATEFLDAPMAFDPTAAQSQAIASASHPDSATPVSHQANSERAQVRGPLAPQRNGGFGGRLMVLLTGGLTMGGAGFGLRHLLTRRRRPRNCERCSQPMMRLDEVADDEYLDSGERLEEQLGSVDYDVWACSACDHAQKIRYGKFFSGYGKCPSCRAKTSTSQSSTLRAATTMMSGIREVETTCAHCNYHDITQHVIPIITQTNNSSSNFSSGSSSFNSGGGTSSGGGASGSW